MASSNIARLGVVLGIDTAAFQADVDKAISENKKLKDAITRDTNAAVKEIANLKYATEDYGKEITKVAQIEREIADGRFKNTAPETVRLLREKAAAYDAVATSSKKATGGMNAQQQLQLTYQTTDLITQIVSGQSAMIALMQQGGQLKDSMGGLGPMFRMLATFITPMNVAIGASVVAVGALGYAFYKGAQEASTFRDQMILTNQYANLTLTGFQNLANVASKELHVGLGDAKEAFMALVSSGQFTEKSLGAVGNVILQVSKLSGDSVSVVAGKLIPAMDGTASSAKRLNDQYHFLTLEQYKHIEALEKQNKFQDAAKLTADAFSEALKGQERQLGLLEKSWNAVADAAKRSWAAILNIGAEKGAEEKLAGLRKALESAQADITGGFANPKVAEERARRIQEQITKLESELEAKRQKSLVAQKETEKINKYKNAGGITEENNIRDAIAKLKLQNDIAFEKQAATEIGKIELDAKQKVEEAKLEMAKKNRDQNGQFALLNEKELFEKTLSISIDREQKIKEVRDKAFVAKLQNEQEYSQMLLEDQAKADDAYNNILKTMNEMNRAEQTSLRVEGDKLQLKYDTLGMSEKEVALRQAVLEYSEKEYQLRQRSDIKSEDKEGFSRRNKELLAEKQALIEFQDHYKTLDEMAKSVYSNMGNYVDEFVRTGKFQFKDFARSVIQDLIAIQMKAQLTALTGGSSGIGGLLKGIFGGFGSGAPKSPVEAPVMLAGGGSLDANQLAIVGEQGPELFMPSGAGTIIPNNLLGGGGGQTINYNGPYIANMSAIDTQSGMQFLAKNKQTIWASYQSANRSVPVSR
ncbi:MAG: phage tail tape measure protein [Betaproteobacteria bacterium]|nr:phage tail tape measure protein [Betaproteobacteria bacterium]